MTARRPPSRPSAPSTGRRPAGRSRSTAGAASRPPSRRGDAEAGRRALGRVDGGRGQRDGRTVADSRARNRRRRLGSGLAATVILVGVLFVAVFPVNSYRTQRAATVRAEADLREVREERARVSRASELLETDAEIEERAREQFGYQRPGEETYYILPAPTEPTGLPDTWPFAGVERAVGSG